MVGKDVEKAFDSVWHNGLKRKILEAKLELHWHSGVLLEQEIHQGQRKKLYFPGSFTGSRNTSRIRILFGIYM